MKKILLTGDKGYIGTNFKYKCGNDFDIIGLDVLDVSYDVRSGVTKLVDNDGIWYWLTTYYNDISAIVHMAAIPGISNCEKDKIKAYDVNVLGTFGCCRLAKKFNIPLIFLSSQAVKSKNSGWYGKNKRYAEEIIEGLLDNYAILRLTNVFGGIEYLERKNTVIKKFLTKDEITIDGSGDQERNFVHVNMVCYAIHQILNKYSDQQNKKYLPPKFKCDIFGPEENTMTIKDLANMVQKITGKNIKFDPYKETGSMIVDIDREKTNFMLEYEPRYTLYDYIKSVWGVMNV